MFYCVWNTTIAQTSHNCLVSTKGFATRETKESDERDDRGVCLVMFHLYEIRLLHSVNELRLVRQLKLFISNIRMKDISHSRSIRLSSMFTYAFLFVFVHAHICCLSLVFWWLHHHDGVIRSHVCVCVCVCVFVFTTTLLFICWVVAHARVCVIYSSRWMDRYGSAIRFSKNKEIFCSIRWNHMHRNCKTISNRNDAVSSRSVPACCSNSFSRAAFRMMARRFFRCNKKFVQCVGIKTGIVMYIMYQVGVLIMLHAHLCLHVWTINIRTISKRTLLKSHVMVSAALAFWCVELIFQVGVPIMLLQHICVCMHAWTINIEQYQRREPC